MLIHGLGGSYRTWDRVIPPIERVARIHAVQLESIASIDQDADDVATLIDAPTPAGRSRGGADHRLVVRTLTRQGGEPTPCVDMC